MDMLRMFTCEQGHAWESALEEGSGPSRCPSCGLPADLGPLLQSALPDRPPAAPIELPAETPLLDDQGHPIIAGYEHLHDLGRSTGGVRLYRARQKVVGRLVLLQVVLAREYNSERAWSFLRGEASAHGKLAHPNIVSIHEVGERDRLLFFNAMEFVEGPTLAEFAAETPLAIAQIAPLMELLARAIGHASDRQILHRHLEPSVVVLQRVRGPKSGPSQKDPGGAMCRLREEYFIPRIRGFGLGRQAVEGDTVDAELYVEAGYLSPEQAGGRVTNLGPQTDVYGLGGILYFLLCGRMPFRGPTLIDILDAIQTAPLVPPTQTRRVPGSLVFICKKALSRPLGRRYADGGAMADDLRRVVRFIPPRGSNLGAATRLDLLCRRRPARVLLLGVLFWGILCVIGLTVTIHQIEGEHQGDLKRTEQRLLSLQADNHRLQRNLDPANAFARAEAYRKQIAFAAAFSQKTGEGIREALDKCLAEERGFEWHYLDRRQARDEQVELPNTAGATTIAYHRSNPLALATLAIVADADERKTYEIRIWDIGKRQALSKVTFTDPVVGLSFVGDSDDVAVLSPADNRLRIYRRGIETMNKEIRPNPISLACSRDGSLLGVLYPAKKVELFDLPTGRMRPSFIDDFPEEKLPPTEIVFRPDGQAFALWSRQDSLITEWSIHGQLLNAHSEKSLVTCVAYGSTGDRAIARRDGTATIESGDNPPYSLLKLPAAAQQMAFSPDGKRLALACGNNTIRIFARFPPNPFDDVKEAIPARWAEVLVVPGSGIRDLAFGPNGKSLAVTGEKGVVVLGDLRP